MSETRFDAQSLFDVRDRTAVITGGSGHFGRAMALALAQVGARVAILGRHIESAQAGGRVYQGQRRHNSRSRLRCAEPYLA